MGRASIKTTLILLTCTLISPLWSATFLVFDSPASYTSALEQLTTQRIAIQSRVPPYVLITNADQTLNTAALGTTRIFQNKPVALESLKNYGPLALAAGIKWNRQFIGVKTAGAMSVQAAKANLPAPDISKMAIEGSFLELSWESWVGAHLYEVQFRGISHFTAKTSLRLVLPIATGPSQTTLRLRAIEDANKGPWSETKRLTLPAYTPLTTAAVPTLTSPANDIETNGFSVTLEWTAVEPHTRLQISKNADFSSPLIDEVLTQREYECPSTLLTIGDTYYWRARAWGNNTSDWSHARTFRVSEPQHVYTDMFINPEAPK